MKVDTPNSRITTTTKVRNVKWVCKVLTLIISRKLPIFFKRAETHIFVNCVVMPLSEKDDLSVAWFYRLSLLNEAR